MNPSQRHHVLRGAATFGWIIMVAAAMVLPASGASAAPAMAAFSQLSLYANIETVGVTVSGTSLPASADLSVRKTGTATWQPAHPLMRIGDGRLAGSLFNLSASTSYDVKVVSGSLQISGTVTTQPDEPQFTPSAIVYVDAGAAAGGNGSAGAPFRSIQEGIDHAGAGTQVLVADGVYHEALLFPGSGTAGNWIQVKAQGSGAILDGSQQRSGDIWTATVTGHVYFTKIGGTIAYLARDGQRFYAYDNLSGLKQGIGHGGIAMSEGWWFDPATLRLYVRNADDPADHTWQIPTLNRAFYAAGQRWLWIEGFEIRYYGTATSGCGICTLNVSHVIIRGNRIHNLQLGVFVNWNGGDTQGNDTRIEFNEIFDPPVNQWPWGAVKGSSMEGTAIVVRGRTGAIVRGNDLHNFFNGIYTGSSAALDNPALAFDADIYNNTIHDIGDDALEPEGACVNHRFRNNVIDRVLVGFSGAPITYGPAWVLRNTISNYSLRAFKWDQGTDGYVRVYHNTTWSTKPAANGMDMISAAHNLLLRNNIFRGAGYNVYEVPTGSTGQDWDRDDWYTAKAVPRFKWENLLYNTRADLCASTGLECNGYDDAPLLLNPAAGNFTLSASSPNIDRGILIPGINDAFSGAAPDIGALESGYVGTVTISGNAGTGGALLSYDNGGPRSVTAGADGSYSISIPAGWSGTVTPTKDGYSFSPPNSVYDNVTESLAGQDYVATPAATTRVQFQSQGAYDGWILESGETTGVGGSKDATTSALILGDDAGDRQYVAVLSFDTSMLPDDAIIETAVLKIKQKAAPTGTNPFSILGQLMADLRSPYFGPGPNLQLVDFDAAAGQTGAAVFSSSPVDGWYRAPLSAAGRLGLNATGLTQFRLYFTLGDNDDRSADFMKFFSGNALAGSRPLLVIQYTRP